MNSIDYRVLRMVRNIIQHLKKIPYIISCGDKTVFDWMSIEIRFILKFFIPSSQKHSMNNSYINYVLKLYNRNKIMFNLSTVEENFKRREFAIQGSNSFVIIPKSKINVSTKTYHAGVCRLSSMRHNFLHSIFRSFRIC